MVHRASVKNLEADGVSLLPKEVKDESDSIDDIRIMAIAMRADRRHSEVTNKNPEEIHIGKNKPQLPTLPEFITIKEQTHITTELDTPREYMDRPSILTKNGLLESQSFIDSYMRRVVRQ